MLTMIDGAIPKLSTLLPVLNCCRQCCGKMYVATFCMCILTDKCKYPGFFLYKSTQIYIFRQIIYTLSCCEVIIILCWANIILRDCYYLLIYSSQKTQNNNTPNTQRELNENELSYKNNRCCN